MANRINVGIVGTKFMGRAHSNAYLSASRFFELPAQPVLWAACGCSMQHWNRRAEGPG